MTDRPRHRGFSMLELLMVLVLFGILAMMAAPSLRGLVARSSTDAVLGGLVGDISYTRMLAVRSGNSATLVVNGTGTGYTITVREPNAAGTAFAQRAVKQVDLGDDAPGFTLSPAPATLTFNSRGLLTGGLATLRAQGRGQLDSVRVLATGRPLRTY